MSKDYPRSYRVADQIQKELSGLIRDELHDPRVPSLLTVASVEVTRDLSIAKVYVSSLTECDRAELLKALTSAAGFLRRLLSDRIRMRSVPALRFAYDDTTEKAQALDHLITQAVASDQGKPDSSSDQ